MAACNGPVPCHVQTTISVGNTIIASSGVQSLGANEAARLGFRLTSTGQAMLQGASGNQLGAHVTLTNGNSVASGQVVLSRYG